MATTWTTISISDLETRKAAKLVNALRTRALGDDQEDPVPQIITETIARIRMEIAAGGVTILSVDESAIPPSLKSLGVRMVLRAAQMRLNASGAMPLSDDERKEWDKDERFLERIAKGEITVEMPADPQSSPTVQSTSFRPTIAAHRSQFDRYSQDGI